jgi:hypothetical protein
MTTPAAEQGQRSGRAAAVTPPVPPPAAPRDVSRMDDFQVIAERRRVMTALAALTDQYRELNQELQRRESLRWMLAR